MRISDRDMEVIATLEKEIAGVMVKMCDEHFYKNIRARSSCSTCPISMKSICDRLGSIKLDLKSLSRNLPSTVAPILRTSTK